MWKSLLWGYHQSLLSFSWSTTSHIFPTIGVPPTHVIHLHLLLKNKCMCNKILPFLQTRTKGTTRGRGNQKNQNQGPQEPKTQPPTLGETILTPTKAKEPTQVPKQGKNQPLHTKKPCACCGVYGHYTHECPLLPIMC
jgi:hypothetical protein